MNHGHVFVENVLPRLLGVTLHLVESLSETERAAQLAYFKTLHIKMRATREATIVALVGLVGCGKSEVSKKIARHIGATIVEADEIRVHLRKHGACYDKARLIAENAAQHILSHGGNVVLDSDFIDFKKRASLREKARIADARLVFVRVTCDFDIACGRILEAEYENSPDSFFGGAKTYWQGVQQLNGRIVKLRELNRRQPLHYNWSHHGGGTWSLRELTFEVFATIDTSDELRWSQTVADMTHQLR